MHQEHCGVCVETYKDEVQRGKRCAFATPPLFFDPRDGIFHERPRAGRSAPVVMVANSKKGFYVRVAGVLQEYFRDSYEGWWIRSYHHGYRTNIPCEASERYRNCPRGVEINTRSLESALASVGANESQQGRPAEPPRPPDDSPQLGTVPAAKK